jgi:hypothetical protein
MLWKNTDTDDILGESYWCKKLYSIWARKTLWLVTLKKSYFSKMVCSYWSRETLTLMTFRVKVTAVKGFVVQGLGKHSD